MPFCCVRVARAIVHVRTWTDWSCCVVMVGKRCGLVGVWELGIEFAYVKRGGARESSELVLTSWATKRVYGVWCVFQ